MKTTQSIPIQKVEDIPAFLKQRKIAKNGFNRRIKNLLRKLKIEAEKHKKTVLFSVTFSKTIVFFGEQQRENLFHRLYYPEKGLYLKEIQIVLIEYLADNSLEYENNIDIHFKFNKKDFDGRISIDRLGFNDEKKRIFEQVHGVGYDPFFESKEKYFLVKNCLIEMYEKVKAKK